MKFEKNLKNEVETSIKKHIKKNPLDFAAYRDYFDWCRNEEDHKSGRWLRDAIVSTVEKKPKPTLILQFCELHESSLKYDAPYDLDAYALYLEYNRERSKSFYLPRRKQLKVVVDSLQDIEDGILDLLCISLPPGAGKSTLSLFFLSWIAGRHPELPALIASHSNALVVGQYQEVLRLMTDEEYNWAKIFSGKNVVKTDAKNLMIDIDKAKRFSTLSFRSLDAGNAGLVRAQSALVADDLCPGLEVALSQDRLETLWGRYTVDLRQRKQGRCPEIHIATRWSNHDVIGRLEESEANNPRAHFIVIPALDENDMSNFDYQGIEASFSTEFYRGQRDILDEASWLALYQGQPIERTGILYHKDELEYYMESPPESDCSGTIAVVDGKDKGKDFCAMPITKIYHDKYYLVDCVCDDSLPEILDERLCTKLIFHKVQQCRWESNSAGGRQADDIQEMIKERGGITKISSRFTTANKETKILLNSSWVKEHVIFPDPSLYKPTSDMGKFMRFLLSYTISGKNAFDDCPDAMAMLAIFAQSLLAASVEIIDRPW